VSVSNTIGQDMEKDIIPATMFSPYLNNVRYNQMNLQDILINFSDY